jgi:polyisoprenoid-binding protein YceI
MEPQKVAGQPDSVWIIDPKYTTVQFSAKLLFLFTVRGSFGDISGTIERDPTDIGRSSVEAVIKSGSVNTGNKRRDSHLRSADFLDVQEHGEIRFKSTRVEKGTDRDTLRVTGTLTIRGRSHEVVLDVNEFDRSRSPQGEDVTYYAALKEIDRFDFGITHSRGLIGRTLKVMVQVQALRKC